MNQRVMFVDNDQRVLSGIERRFGLTFDLVTASSAASALDKFDSHGPLAVVVVDMRLRRMSGIQWIHAARKASPDTVFILLASNPDCATVLQALNESQVFRFLTKPCEGEEMVDAVKAGLRQYQLETAEKQLLHDTFYGSISVLTDVLEIAQPRFYHCTRRIQDIFESLRIGMRVDQHWEFKLATRLALLGVALMPEEERLALENGAYNHENMNRCFSRSAAIGKTLIEKIPRLETVAAIIGQQTDIDGSAIMQVCKTHTAKSYTGATLLRCAILWDYLTRQGLRASAVIAEMRRSMPNLSVDMTGVLEGLPVYDLDKDSIEVLPSELRVGMVVSTDILTRTGTVLISKGRRITHAILEKLRSYPAADEQLQAIRVTRSSVPRQSELMHA